MYFSPVIDLKFIRAGVDTLFNFVSPRPEDSAAIDLQINKILQRSDEFVGNLEYENMAKDRIEKLKSKQAKQEKQKIKQNKFRSGLTTMIGAIMQKQQCWEYCACTFGSILRNGFPGKDIIFA